MKAKQFLWLHLAILALNIPLGVYNIWGAYTCTYIVNEKVQEKIPSPPSLDSIKNVAFSGFDTIIQGDKDILVIMSPFSSCVKKGEQFKAALMLLDLSAIIKPNEYTIFVNGNPVKLKDGIGYYTTTANGLGENRINISTDCSCIITGERLPRISSYSYQVIK